MAHRLAVMAGELNVEDMLCRMTARQWQRWCHYFEIEPFGAVRDNYHAALMAKMVADVNGATSARTKEPFTHEELLLTFDGVEREPPPPQPSPRKQTVEEQMQMARLIALVYNTNGETKSYEDLKRDLA